MRLKDYQERALREVKRFLEQLIVWRGKARQDDEWLFDFAEKAWEKARIGEMYLKKKDGLGRPLPVFCLKVPTGGGKTLLAVKTIDLVQNIYRQRQTGLVVWIVPSTLLTRGGLGLTHPRSGAPNLAMTPAVGALASAGSAEVALLRFLGGS